MENYTDTFMAVIILLLQSLIIREVVAYLGQKWIKSFAHTATILLLPITTYFITSVIANNIALSLGMVGALSIVRFRNPVKSPFELIIFFIAITMGVTASVHLKWLILFFISIIFVILVIKILDKIFNILKKDYFTKSFTEGEIKSSLEIVSNTNEDDLLESKFLISSNFYENKYSYLLSSNNEYELKEIQKKYLNKKNIIENKFFK